MKRIVKQLWIEFKARPLWRKICDILLVLFALAGAAIIGAWGLYQLGVTNNRGGVDKNYRSLMAVSEIERMADHQFTQDELDELWARGLDRLAALSHSYPVNTRLILQASTASNDPMIIDRMVAALSIYTDTLSTPHSPLSAQNVIPWMNGPEWGALKQAILRDSALINEAGRLTGVEPRLIVACLVGEQIRLFNSKREMFKKYLGPVKVLSVESQFSYGVNGIKDHTAQAVEQHLKDPASEFYMGKAYEHLLDFETDDHETERYNRLVDYRNHLYSYLYTGCILHQTMLQWRRAGYDISDRPELLVTLFNVGFAKSVPKANPQAGGSTIEVCDRDYTFGGLGFDFYYSGELATAFPYWRQRFTDHPLTAHDIARIQAGVSDCARPEKGLEYRRAPATQDPQSPDESPDPFGVDHETVRPMEHTAQ